MNGLNYYNNSLKIALFKLVEKIKFTTNWYKLAFVPMCSISLSGIPIQIILKGDYHDDDCCCGGNCCCGEWVWTPEDTLNPLGLKNFNYMENSNIMMALYSNPIWIITIIGLIGLLIILLLSKIGKSGRIVKKWKSDKSSSKYQGWWFFWWWKSKPQESSVPGTGTGRAPAASASAPSNQRELNERWSWWWWKSNSKPIESWPLPAPQNQEERTERLSKVNDGLINYLNGLMDKRPRRWINDEDIPEVQDFTNELLNKYGISDERRYEHLIPSLVKGFRVLNAPDLQKKYNEIDSSLGALKTKRHIIPNINYKPETGEMRLEIEFAPDITTSIGSNPRDAINKLRGAGPNVDPVNVMGSTSRPESSSNIKSEVANNSRPISSSGNTGEASSPRRPEGSNINTPETSDNKSVISSDTNINNFTRVSEEAICYKDFVEQYINKSMALEIYNTSVLNYTIIIMGVLTALFLSLKLLKSNHEVRIELKKEKLSGFFGLGSVKSYFSQGPQPTGSDNEKYISKNKKVPVSNNEPIGVDLPISRSIIGNDKSNGSTYKFDIFQDTNIVNYSVHLDEASEGTVKVIGNIFTITLVILLSLLIIMEIYNSQYDKNGNRKWWGINFVSIYNDVKKKVQSIIRKIKIQFSTRTTTNTANSTLSKKQEIKTIKITRKKKWSVSRNYIAGCGISKVAEPARRGTFAPRPVFTDDKDRVLPYDDQVRLTVVNIKGIELSRKIGRRADINTDYAPPNMHYNKDLQAWEFHVIFANLKKTRNVFIMRDDKDVKVVEKFIENVPLKTGANFYNVEGNSIYCVTRRGDSHIWGGNSSNVGANRESQSSVNRSVKYNEESINTSRLNDNINNIIDSSSMLYQTFYSTLLNYIIVVIGTIFGLVLILKLLKNNDNKFGFAILTIVPGQGITGLGEMSNIIIDPVKFAVEIGVVLLFILQHPWFKFFMDYCGIVGLIVLWHVCTSIDVKILSWRIQAELKIYFKKKKNDLLRKWRKIEIKWCTMWSSVPELFTDKNGNVLPEPEQSRIRGYGEEAIELARTFNEMPEFKHVTLDYDSTNKCFEINVKRDDGASQLMGVGPEESILQWRIAHNDPEVRDETNTTTTEMDNTTTEGSNSNISRITDNNTVRRETANNSQEAINVINEESSIVNRSIKYNEGIINSIGVKDSINYIIESSNMLCEAYYNSIFYDINILLILCSIMVIIMLWVINRENSVIKKYKRADVPLAWGIYFQDGASPSVEGIVDLHNRIMFYLVVILFGVSSVMISIMWNFNKGYNKLVYRYLNHGTLIELIWTVGPALVLVAIAFPSFKLLYLMD
jgi:Cytochrome C oxidase subunit II, transmembrane domain